ncbi:hypothetical protein [Adhaeribacter aquaticus]|uniref:hypothetical protein n=1 Tax=Adhaeribacter aquaticus TaxID=299567 RepID=UPI0003F5E3EC|nr:hypothetical protein [Adhaeribacter aquaticus]
MDNRYFDFSDLLEPVAGPLTVIVLVVLVVFAIKRRRNFNRRLYNAITRPTIIYQQAPAPPPAPLSNPMTESSVITNEEFTKLTWEQKEEMYRNRIIQLRDANRKLRALLKEAGLPTD